jgi:hypothetical protein
MKRNIVYNQDFGAPPPPPPPGYTPPPPPTANFSGGTPDGSASTNAIIALVAGIVGWLGCYGIAGVVAWIMGRGEIKKIDRGEAPEAGRTFAKIGMWLGIANVIVSILAIIGFVLYILFIAVLVGSSTR